MVTRAELLLLLALAILLIAIAPGCSTLDKGLDQVARGVNYHCANVPLAARLETRARLNARIAPHRARIDCDGDPTAQP